MNWFRDMSHIMGGLLVGPAACREQSGVILFPGKTGGGDLSSSSPWIAVIQLFEFPECAIRLWRRLVSECCVNNNR
jgi:hypothetical protein